MLVYVPLLTLEGIEGKMFRPMAITMACALFGALVYSVVFFPALLVALRPAAEGARAALDRARSTDALRAARAARSARSRWPLAGAAVGVRSSSRPVLLRRAGADFVPRIYEGDVVVDDPARAEHLARRGAQARPRDGEGPRTLSPRSSRRSGMTGRAEVAIDPVGNDNTDILVPLGPVEGVDDRATTSTSSPSRIKNAIETRGARHVRLRLAAHRGQDQRAHQRLARRRADQGLRRPTSTR